jgi:fibronectin-binding autotransporter adhesin
MGMQIGVGVRTVVAAILCLSFRAGGQSGTWTNLLGGSWQTADNWNGGVIASGTDAAADFSTLDLAANGAITLDGNVTVGSLLFSDTAAAHFNWTLDPGTPAGILTLDVSAGAPVINVTTATTTIAAQIAGTDGLTKQGRGTLALTVSNTYSGVTTVASGILQVNNDHALGDSSSGTVIAPGIGMGYATLQLNAGRVVSNETLTLSGLGNTERAVLRSSGATWVGDVIIASGNNLNLLQTDSGTFRLYGNVTNNGTAGGGLQLRGGGSGEIHGDINIPGGLGKNDGGTWTLYGTNNSWSSMAVSQGILRMGADNACVPTVPVTYATDKTIMTLDLNGFDQTVRGISAGTIYSGKVVSATAATLTIDTLGSTYTSLAAIQGAISLVKAGTGVQILQNTNTWSGSTTISNGTLRILREDVLPDATDVILAGGWLDLNSGNDTVRSLTIASTLGGLSNATSAGKALSLAATDTALVWTTPEAIAGNLALTATDVSRVVVTGFTGGSISMDGILDLGPTNRIFNIGDVNAAGSDFFLNAQLTGAGGIIKTGAGTLKPYHTANTFTGPLEVQQGAVFLQHVGNRIHDAAAVRIAGGSFDLNTTTEKVGRVTLASGGISGSLASRLESDIGFDVESGSISGGANLVLAGAGGLTKTTAGGVTVSATLAYTGDTRVSEGMLTLTGTATPSNSPVIEVASGATLDGSGLAATLALRNGQTLKGGGTVQGGLIAESGATVAPGSSPGILTLEDDLTMNAGSVFSVELTGLAVGTGYDQLAFSGANDTLTLNSPTLALTDTTGFPVSSVFTILTGFQTLGGDGIFAGLAAGATVTTANNQYEINYTTTSVTLTVVPEPGTLGTVGVFGLLLVLRRRSRG